MTDRHRLRITVSAPALPTSLGRLLSADDIAADGDEGLREAPATAELSADF